MDNNIQVTRSSMPELEEYVSEIKELWDSHWLTNMGKKHKQLQKELEELLGVEHVALYCNGHLALENILEALDLTPGGEIITSPYTFASTTHAIVRCGFEPVFCDIDPVDFTIDTDRIEELITDKTVAILPIHVYGNFCDVEKIKKIADSHGLKVIYDAAHAFAASYKGRSAASYGDAAMFSFHATKVFNTIEGGAVCYHEDRLEQRLKDLKNFGIHGPEEVAYVGGNAKMNEFCAAMGICNLRHLDDEINKRKAVVARYREQLSGTEGLYICPEQKDVISNYAYFPAVFDSAVFGCDRDRVFAKLEENGICARKYFYPITSAFDCYKGRFDPCKTPVALKVSESVLTLPLYSDLDHDTVDKICEIIKSLNGGNK